MPKTIMIIDDSMSIRKVVSITLKKAGYDVMEAGDGKEALSKLTGQKINLIICDLNMPNMDGISFIKALKQMQNYRFSPVIMLTTESQAEKMQEGREAGAKAWIVKPFMPETMLAAIDKLILP